MGSENANFLRGRGSGDMFPGENFRKFGLPWTTFYAF